MLQSPRQVCCHARRLASVPASISSHTTASALGRVWRAAGRGAAVPRGMATAPAPGAGEDKYWTSAVLTWEDLERILRDNTMEVRLA